jgi:hypothetical protein
MLRTIAPELWGVETEQPLPGGVRLPLRMTVARLSDGTLWLHSPVPIDDALAAQLEALGPVGHIVAPSGLHHLHAGPAVARWPAARLWVAPALQQKRPDLTPATPLPPAGAPWPDIEVLRIDGVPSFDEHVFFHRPSSSLLVTDLVFQVLRTSSWVTPWVLRLTGTWGRYAHSRLWGWSVKDKAAAARSAREVLAWPFTRVVMCHGDVLEDDAHHRTAEVLRPMLGG